MPIFRSHVVRVSRASRRALAAFTCCLLVMVCSGVAAAKPVAKRKRLLIVSVTKGFRHESIPTAERVLIELAERQSLAIDFARTDDELRDRTSAANLKRYAAVVFASTTGDLPLADRAAFLRFIRDGGAFIGIHAATDTFRKGVFPEYLAMLGGEFQGHGPQKSVRVRIDDPRHPATEHLRADETSTAGFEVYDEIYRIVNFDSRNVRLLLSLDRHPDTGAPGLFPLAWCRAYGKGRVFYTALGHRDDVLTSDWFRRHLEGGVLWTLRKNWFIGSSDQRSIDSSN